MGYALFAQRKLCLTGQLNSLNLQQTQRSNEQLQLSSNTLSLQKQLTSLQTAQATQLAGKYEELANSGSDYEFNRDTEQYTDKNGNSYSQEQWQNNLSEERARIQAEIHQIEEKFKVEEDVINRQIYQVSIKENAIEMEVKRIDTKVTAVQKQLEAVQEAEGSGIDRATPKFNGIG